MKVKFVGKSLVIGDKILVVSDLHLGYDGSLRERGYMFPFGSYRKTIDDLDKIFKFLGKKVERIIILGDLKHEIGKVLYEERDEVASFIKYLRKKAREIIIVRGNHDVMLNYLFKDQKIKIVDFFILDKSCFLHGDREIKVMHNKKIEYWIMGHFHPAVVLQEGVKKEKYKCFLVGKHRGKEVIILPSFFSVNEGSDPRDGGVEIPWSFRLNSFNVKVVSDLEVLDFGKLGKIFN